ncbi:MAG: exonuclease SbcCD subunit D [Bacteroidaceae bacterium]|nr:exonuclease SbcCD subunit D [Bacteroidaceae bacterium]
MKILHTADLHIGKRINGFSMLEEQKFILNKIVSECKRNDVDAIVLAGDIYDKSVPSAEAVTLFDEFLVNLSKLNKQIFIISGNHDSAERLAFASRLLDECGVHVAPVYSGKVSPIVISDEFGEVAVYLLPFIKPQIVQHFAGDNVKISTYEDAVRYVIDKMEIDNKRRNILVTHQFITGAESTDSEDVMVGGLDNIDAAVFKVFDYVALGHLHRPQCCGRETVRYSGSPLKYSFSEVKDNKSLSLITLAEDKVDVKEIELSPMHDWHDLRGTYEELADKSSYDGKTYQEDYVRITLTNEDDIPDGMRKLQTIYHRLMELRYDNKRTRQGMVNISVASRTAEKQPQELVEELFEKQNGRKLSEEQSEYLNELIKSIWN